jgi:hypothetical protein
MKKCISLSVCLCLFINAFTQNTVQDEGIHFNENDIKNTLNSIHPDLLFLEIKEKTELELSEISSLELVNDTMPKNSIFNVGSIYSVSSGWNGLIGVAFGPETVMSFLIPKIGALNFRPTSNERFHYFYGGEVNLWILSAVWGSVAITSGVKYGAFTLETNFSTFFRPRLSADNGDKFGPYFHTAFNPKIGLYIKGIWLRFGPSFILYKKYAPENWALIEPLRRGELRYNFEVVFVRGGKK